MPGYIMHSKSDKPVLPVFIFDRNILDELEDKTDRRVEFIHLALLDMQRQLVKMGSTLDVRYGTPEAVYKEIIQRIHNRESVYQP